MRRPGQAVSPWSDAAWLWPGPALVVLGHLIGGAGGLMESAALTLAAALLAGVAFAQGRLDLDPAYLRSLRLAGAAFLLILLMALVSVTTGSAVLADGWIAERAGLSTLSVDPEATWVEIVKLSGILLLFILAYRHASSASRLARTLRIMVGLTALWACWALMLFATGARGGDGVARLSGTFASPNVAASVLATGLFCLMALQALKDGRRAARRQAPDLFAACCALAIGGALILTASRSGVVIFTLLAGAWWVAPLLNRNRLAHWPGRRKLIFGLVGFAALALVAWTGSGFAARISGLGEEAANRSVIIGTYVEAARESPVFGHGLGTGPRISRLLITPENDAVMWNIRAAHNLPVQWWLETGLAGLGLAALCGALVLGGAVRRLAPSARRALAPLVLVSGFMLLQGLVDYAAQVYSVVLTWAFVVGLVHRASVHWAAAPAQAPTSRSPRTRHNPLTGSAQDRAPPRRPPLAGPQHSSAERGA